MQLFSPKNIRILLFKFSRAVVKDKDHDYPANTKSNNTVEKKTATFCLILILGTNNDWRKY